MKGRRNITVQTRGFYVSVYLSWIYVHLHKWHLSNTHSRLKQFFGWSCIADNFFCVQVISIYLNLFPKHNCHLRTITLSSLKKRFNNFALPGLNISAFIIIGWSLVNCTFSTILYFLVVSFYWWRKPACSQISS